jgi:hypothetical protein
MSDTENDRTALASVAGAAVDSVVDTVVTGIKSGNIFVLSQTQPQQRQAKSERMKKYHTVTSMIAKAKKSNKIPDNAPPEVFEAIQRAKAQKKRTYELIRQENERKAEILNNLVGRRDREKKVIEKWEQERFARMEELQKFKDDQMTKKQLEWRQRREDAKKKNQEMTKMAKNIVRGHKRQVPIHEQLEKNYKQNVLYPEMERAKQHLDARTEERMKPMGDSIKIHEAQYLQSQARRIQNAAQQNSEMVRGREVDLGFHVNKAARERALADDRRARTEAKMKKEALAARVAEARRVLSAFLPITILFDFSRWATCLRENTCLPSVPPRDRNWRTVGHGQPHNNR